ncbi:hypothetical protein SmJEL517_g03045 [Synchytrium microbalum]|uniref:Magnesium transporter n=1 Tax=Synchytrium microbalum TaxID=1806994 RepID=A0A507C8B2_9FUNG|nr:uncharacterized protein SmJEL517_g03045 [Synchytrium microbalum]TPX34254.1 hypothetical protein SmJEL517_g03045 [Synchytrium microbalum]
MTVDEKYIGLALALASSVFIGVSFVLMKMGLMDGQKQHGIQTGEHYSYLQNVKWWIGMGIMIAGEAANFAAYSYAPAILVTPLGAGSVLVSAVLASILLKERLGSEGKIGCALCMIGAIVIILHAPGEKDIESVDEILDLAVQPAFMMYMLLVIGVALYLIYKVAPIHGKSNMLVYIAICSLVGSISVMACKGFGIALKLTFAGNNQLSRPSTYLFGMAVVVCAVTQMNYFNKALDLFSTNRVMPIYYVFFTTATILASVSLFQGFNETDSVKVLSVFCGFFTIFIGVFMLNSKRENTSHDLSKPSLRASMVSRNGGANGHVDDRVALVSESHLLKTFDDESGEEELYNV